MEKKEKQSYARNFNVNKIIIFFCLIVVVIVGIFLGKNYLTEKKANDNYENLADRVNSVLSSTEEAELITETEALDSLESEGYSTDLAMLSAQLGIDIPQKNMEWDYLKSVNEDIYAWIYIPNTNIDYPVLQSGDDDSYYLNYNIDGSRGYPGCIYSEMINGRDFADCMTVLYGHNMKKGTMFRTLHYYEEENFFLENPYIYVYTEDGVLVYEVFAAYNRDDKHLINSNDFSKESGYEAYINDIEVKASEGGGNYNENMLVTTSNHILSLSTCTDKSNERYIVNAVLVNDSKPVYYLGTNGRIGGNPDLENSLDNSSNDGSLSGEATDSQTGNVEAADSESADSESADSESVDSESADSVVNSSEDYTDGNQSDESDSSGDMVQKALQKRMKTIESQANGSLKKDSGKSDLSKVRGQGKE